MKHALITHLRLSPAATADCVTAATHATGIAFTREDGRTGPARLSDRPPAMVPTCRASRSFLAPVGAACSGGTTRRHLCFPEIGPDPKTRTRGTEGQPAQRRGLTALKPAP